MRAAVTRPMPKPKKPVKIRLKRNWGGVLMALGLGMVGSAKFLHEIPGSKVAWHLGQWIGIVAPFVAMAGALGAVITVTDED